jgi:hypothetical protein
MLVPAAFNVLPHSDGSVSTLRPMHVPESPDPRELERLLVRLSVLVDLRTTPDNADRARDLVATIETVIDETLESPSKHRDWRSGRYRVLELLTELDRVLYYQLP